MAFLVLREGPLGMPLDHSHFLKSQQQQMNRNPWTTRLTSSESLLFLWAVNNSAIKFQQIESFLFVIFFVPVPLLYTI